MDRRLAETTDQLRFRIDPTRCDGQGVCVLIAPEIFELDRYGFAYVVPGSDQVALADREVRARGLEADAMCPRNAIREELARALGPAPAEPERRPEPATSPRLLLDRASTGPDGPGPVESVEGWRARGGWTEPGDTDLIDLAERAGLTGQGGASFPTGAKWRRVEGKSRPVVVVNGAEREPGTVKDRYLLAHRPGLVLDGLRLAMRAVGASEAVAAIDEDAAAEHDALLASIAEARSLGLLAGLDIRTHKVPTRYVAGEETALLSLIDGGGALPRARPPYPSDIGLSGRPTLVQNVETLADLALAMAMGIEDFRAAGTADSPSTGLFSVGTFGGTMTLFERPYGYPLRSLLAEAGQLDGLRAALVGGYAGGLLGPEALDVALTRDSLAAAGACIGTKSIQTVGAGQCPVGATAKIVGYFGTETARQCPPCWRGLPDMAALLNDLESGHATPGTVAELRAFMSTLSGRGICRLPDGAARLVMSLLTNFADEVEKHLGGPCPLR
jgi:NADH:ubiquinone oxidoreductase subunit F (NADH-binding)/ferredoxin